VSGGPGAGGQVGGSSGGVVKAAVALRPGLRVVRVRGRYFVRVSGTVPRALAGRKLMVQRKVGRRVVLLSRVKIRRDGSFAARVRMPARAVTMRTVLGSTPGTTSAASRFRTLRR
jgi:hypothetical protein